MPNHNLYAALRAGFPDDLNAVAVETAKQFVARKHNQLGA